MNRFKSHFVFSKSRRNGIVLLLACIVIAQAVYFFADFSKENTIDANSEDLVLLQRQMDSLREAALEEKQPKIFPFNPNYISEHKGYTLGMTAEEIERLHRFRNENKWVNSAKEFQEITQVSDSLLAEISPFFQFPEWVTNPKPRVNSSFSSEKSFAEKTDLNKATAEQLQKTYGIGEVLSKRILDYREKLGGFLVDEQLYDVYGLENAVVKNILKEFTVKEKPEVEKININTASASDIATLPFISFQLAKEIVDYRLLREGIRDFEELKKVDGFPAHKLERFALYLTLE